MVSAIVVVDASLVLARNVVVALVALVAVALVASAVGRSPNRVAIVVLGGLKLVSF